MKSNSQQTFLEICNHCGDSVAFGSGKFVNRIPDFNDVETRIFYGRNFPNGEFICESCDNLSQTENE